jgi:transposase-like protein
MTARHRSDTSFTENDKIEIIHQSRDGVPKRRVAASLGKNESTVRSFLKSYESHDILSPPHGRLRHNFPLPPVVVDDMTKRLDSEPRLTLRRQLGEFEN